MHRQIRISLLVVLVVGLLTAARPIRAESTAQNNTFPHYTMVMITGVEMLPADAHVMSQIVEHADNVCQIARAAGYNCCFKSLSDVAGTSPKSIETTPAGCIFGYIVLVPRESESPGDPREVAQRVAKELERFLGTKLHAPRIRAAIQKEEKACFLVSIREREVAELQARVISYTSISTERCGGISIEGSDQQLRELRGQRMMLEIDLAGLRAQRKAVLKRIAERKDQLAKQADEPDYELEKLENVSRSYRRDYERLQEANKKMPGSVPLNEIEHVKTEMRQAELNIQAHQARKRQTHDDLLAGLSQQLSDIDIQTAGGEAKLETIHGMLERINPKTIQTLAGQIEQVRSNLAAARENLAAARRNQDELERRRAAMHQPQVTVLDELNSANAADKTATEHDQ